MNLAPGSRGTPPQAFTWKKVLPVRGSPPPRLTGQSASVGYPTSHVNTVKEKGEVIWKGSGPHLAVVPHLPGVPPLPCKQTLKICVVGLLAPLLKCTICESVNRK